MSTQQSAPGAAPSRITRPVSWLRDLPIWTKLGLIMIVPTLATIIVGTTGLLEHVDAANNADRARTLVGIAGDAGTLVHALQGERAVADQLLDVQNPDAKTTAALTAGYTKAAGLTDLATGQYHLSRSTLADVPDNLDGRLGDIENDLAQLPALRAQVADRSKISLSAAEQRYGNLITELLSIRDLAAQLTGDTTLTARLQAAGAIASMNEFLAQEQVLVSQTLAAGELTQANRRAIDGAQIGADLALTTFKNSATSDQEQFYESKVAGKAVSDVVADENRLSSLVDGANPTTVLKPADWQAATGGRAALMIEVETTLNKQAQAAAVDLGDAGPAPGAARDRPAAADPAARRALRLVGRPLDGPLAARPAPGRARGRPVRPAAGGGPAARSGAVVAPVPGTGSPCRSPSRCRCAAGTSSGR